MAKKVILNGETIIDLTDTTAVAQDVTKDKIFYDANGVRTLGTYEIEKANLKTMDYDGDTTLVNYGPNNYKMINTNYLTSINYLFRNCSNLISVDLSQFDISNITSMSNAFYSCTSLTNLDLSNWYTSNVTTMTNMFRNCTSLQTLDIRNFDFTNVTNYGFSGTFRDIPTTCKIYVNQAAYNKIVDTMATNYLASADMLVVVNN